MPAMSRVFNHYYSQRKLALFLAEESLILAAAVAGALAVAGPSNLHPSSALKLGAVLMVALQLSLYFGDLYDLRVAQADRARGTRLLRFLGLAVILSAVLIGLELPALPRGAVLGGVVGSAFAVIAARAVITRHHRQAPPGLDPGRRGEGARAGAGHRAGRRGGVRAGGLLRPRRFARTAQRSDAPGHR